MPSTLTRSDYLKKRYPGFAGVFLFRVRTFFGRKNEKDQSTRQVLAALGDQQNFDHKALATLYQAKGQAPLFITLFGKSYPGLDPHLADLDQDTLSAYLRIYDNESRRSRIGIVTLQGVIKDIVAEITDPAARLNAIKAIVRHEKQLPRLIGIGSLLRNDVYKAIPASGQLSMLTILKANPEVDKPIWQVLLKQFPNDTRNVKDIANDIVSRMQWFNHFSFCKDLLHKIGGLEDPIQTVARDLALKFNDLVSLEAIGEVVDEIAQKGPLIPSDQEEICQLLAAIPENVKTSDNNPAVVARNIRNFKAYIAQLPKITSNKELHGYYLGIKDINEKIGFLAAIASMEGAIPDKSAEMRQRPETGAVIRAMVQAKLSAEQQETIWKQLVDHQQLLNDDNAYAQLLQTTAKMIIHIKDKGQLNSVLEHIVAEKQGGKDKGLISYVELINKIIDCVRAEEVNSPPQTAERVRQLVAYINADPAKKERFLMATKTFLNIDGHKAVSPIFGVGLASKVAQELSNPSAVVAKPDVKPSQDKAPKYSITAWLRGSAKTQKEAEKVTQPSSTPSNKGP